MGIRYAAGTAAGAGETGAGPVETGSRCCLDTVVGTGYSKIRRRDGGLSMWDKGLDRLGRGNLTLRWNGVAPAKAVQVRDAAPQLIIGTDYVLKYASTMGANAMSCWCEIVCEGV